MRTASDQPPAGLPPTLGGLHWSCIQNPGLSLDCVLLLTPRQPAQWNHRPANVSAFWTLRDGETFVLVFGPEDRLRALAEEITRSAATPYDKAAAVESYLHDMQQERAETAPQVVIVEPSYNDGPHIGPDHPNDNHPPLAVGWGEDFLRRVYEAATVNPALWAGTVMVVYADEHGGFHDHVPPPPIAHVTTGTPAHAFRSTGPRIPGIVVSPLVKPGSVCSQLLDHTSVLQLLAEIFTPGQPYSPSVEERRRQGIGSLSVALGDQPRPDVPVAHLLAEVRHAPNGRPHSAPAGPAASGTDHPHVGQSGLCRHDRHLSLDRGGNPRKSRSLRTQSNLECAEHNFRLQFSGAVGRAVVHSLWLEFPVRYPVYRR